MSFLIFPILFFSFLSFSHCQITLSGTGTVSATPDTATIFVGVTTASSVAATALSSNNATSRRLLRLLVRLGISQRDVQTRSFNVFPEFSNTNNNRPQRITGYTVTNDFRVIVRNIDDLGKILDEVVKGGSNTLDSVTFSIENRERFLQQARKLAVQDAKQKANTFAKATGVKVGKLIRIEQPGTVILGGRSGFSSSFSSGVPVATGQIDVTANVVLSFEIA